MLKSISIKSKYVKFLVDNDFFKILTTWKYSTLYTLDFSSKLRAYLSVPNAETLEFFNTQVFPYMASK